MNRISKYSFLSLLILTISCSSLYGQRHRSLKTPDQRFQLVIISGLNLSQIDGDYFTGFDQSGLNAGLQVDAILGPRTSLTMGMHFSQKGAKIPHGTRLEFISRNDRQVRLNYVEVPLLFKSMLKLQSHGPYVELGASFSRLSSSNIVENDRSQIRGTVYEDILPFFDKTDINIVAGLGFTIGRRFGFTFRYNYGIAKFYNNPTFELPNPLSGRAREVAFLRNYNIGLLLSYRII